MVQAGPWWLELTLLPSPFIPSSGSAGVLVTWCFLLAHTTSWPRSCQYPRLLCVSFIPGFFPASKSVFFVQDLPESQNTDFSFLLGRSQCYPGSLLSVWASQTLTLVSSLYPLKTSTCRIYQSLFLQKSIVPLVCVCVWGGC